MMDGRTYDRSFYERQYARSLRSARVVLGKLFPLLQPRRVVDIGCGVGTWVKAALDLGASEGLGVDGAYVEQSMLMIPPAQFRSADLETETLTELLADELAQRFDLAISLETAEHLPYARAESFVSELTTLSDVILFGAAVPFQSGTHHVNEQWPEFWALLFRTQGYECWDWLRGELWADRDVDWWYAQNTLVFAKSGSVAAASLPEAAKVHGRSLALVHPENFLSNLLGEPRTYRAAALGEELQDFYTISAAQARQARAMPELAALARARLAGPQARDVFPWTRSEISDPARQIEVEQRKYMALEELARSSIAHREAAEEQVARLQQRREKDKGIIAQIHKQLLQARMQVSALETRCESIGHELAATRAQLDRLCGSKLWRALGPVRYVADKMPPSQRRLLRRAAKLSWWTMTLYLPAKLRARRAAATALTGRATTFAAFQPAVLTMAEERLLRFAPFDSGKYLAMNPDVAAANVSAAWHATRFGAQEGRRLFSDDGVARAIGSLAESPDDQATPVAFPEAASRVPIGVYCNSHGNIFMKEIAEDFVADLHASGAQVRLLDETAPKDARPPVCLFIAPHEFFVIGAGTEWLREDIITQSFMLNTEQVQTSWFARALPYLLMARGVIDICSQSAQLQVQAGIEAVNMQHSLLHVSEGLREGDQEHPLFKVLPAAAKRPADPALAWEARRLDLSFFGALSSHREMFFARHAARFAGYESFLYCRRARTSLAAGGKNGGLTRIAAHVAAHSKISLNIHQDEFSYFEWHRIVKLGIYAGSVVVSEPCLPHPAFIAGTHYFQENQRYIPDLLDWLLKTPDGQAAAAKVRDNNRVLLRNPPSSCEALAPIAHILWRGHE